MGFEPLRGNPNGLAVHCHNHSATSSCCNTHLVNQICDCYSNMQFDIDIAPLIEIFFFYLQLLIIIFGMFVIYI